LSLAAKRFWRHIPCMAAAGHIVDRPVKVTSNYGKEVHTTVKVLEWSPEERTSRMWKRIGISAVITLLAGLVPPHIPWITLAFIGSVIGVWIASRQGAMIQKQQVACPDCGTLGEVDEQAETWPLGVRCSPCGNAFWLNPEGEKKAA